MEKEKRKTKRQEKGITLIALVITIIVLLILAGVSIAMLTGENGILTQAQNAKIETTEAQENELRRLTALEAATNLENTTFMDNSTGKEVPITIPAGFAISQVEGENTVKDGLVIIDANENEFVWVPVEDFTEFKRYDFKNDTELSSNYTEDSGDGIIVNEGGSESEKEAQEMYKSVKDNGGFYIGRYEAGNDGSGNAISKKNVILYNNIPWENDEANGIIGAVEKARNFDTQSGHTNVTSTLIYGVQWDAVMRWISKDDNLERYLTDSSGIGNYSGTLNSITGANDNYQIKNIYDLAGNVWEMTMESYDTVYRISRGGDFGNDGNPYPCSDRTIGSVNSKVDFKRIPNSFVHQVEFNINRSLNGFYIS